MGEWGGGAWTLGGGGRCVGDGVTARVGLHGAGLLLGIHLMSYNVLVRFFSVNRLGNRTELRTSVLENQELKWNRNSRFRFGSASVLGFFGSVLGSRFFLPRTALESFSAKRVSMSALVPRHLGAVPGTG